MGLGQTGLPEGQVGFERVTKVSSLLPIVENRLPKGCNVYNMIRNNNKFQNEMSFYILNTNQDTSFKDSVWIVATYARDDYGVDVNISEPRDLSRITEFKKALLSSGIINWNEPFIFAAADSEICPVIQELIKEGTGKGAFTCKNRMFYTTELLNDPIPPHLNFIEESSNVVLKQLDTQTGAKFLVDNWAFAKPGSLTYVRKLVERNPSAGVYVDGKLVAAAGLNGSGMITMLHTLEDYRRRGFAQLCMRYFASVLLAERLIPCCTVESHNSSSLALQRKIGLIDSSEVSYIYAMEDH